MAFGDFNTPGVDWNLLSPTQYSQFAKLLCDLSWEVCLTRHVEGPTRFAAGQRGSVLDLVFTHVNDTIDLVYLPPLGSSDHATLLMDWDVVCHRMLERPPR